MLSSYSDSAISRALLTMQSVEKAICQLREWNEHVACPSFYYESPQGMQLLAADCMLITAIGEGINRVLKVLPDYLETAYSDIPWKAIIGMRNHIAHGYFEIDADLVFEAVRVDIPDLHETVLRVVDRLRNRR